MIGQLVMEPEQRVAEMSTARFDPQVVELGLVEEDRQLEVW